MTELLLFQHPRVFTHSKYTILYITHQIELCRQGLLSQVTLVLGTYSEFSTCGSNPLSLNFWPITQLALPIQQEESSVRAVQLMSLSLLWVNRCFIRGKRPKVMCCPSLPCVWFAGLSAALQEHRWLKGTKHVNHGAANGPCRVKRVRGWLNHTFHRKEIGSLCCQFW